MSSSPPSPVRADLPDAVVLDVRMPPSHATEGLQAALEQERARELEHGIEMSL